MAILTEPTVIRDDNSDDAVILAAYYGIAQASSQFVCRRHDDSADFWVAKHNWFGVGDGTNVGNKYFVARTGAANEPFIRYNVSSSAWELSDNGVNYNRLGPTAIPTFAGLFIIRDGSGAYFYQRTYTGSAWSVLFFDRARGTSGAPTAVQSGDVLGGIQFRGWDGSDWGLGGFIYAYTAENFSTTAHGTYLRFYTVPTGSISYYERMRINHDGVVYIYSTADPCLSLAGGLKIASYTGVLFASSGTVSALAATGGSQYLRRNAGNTAYEWATISASDVGAAPIGSAYVTIGNDATLTNERALAVGASLTLTDGGANGSVTLNTVQDIRTTATPKFASVDAINTDYSTYMLTRVHSNTNYSARMIMDRTRGTSGTPTAVQSGDAIGQILFRGYDGSTYPICAMIYAYAAENFSTTAHGTHLRFYTTPIGSTSYTERMRITSEGVIEAYYSVACYGDGHTSNMYAYRYTSDSVGPELGLAKARGTRSSPSAVALSDTLGDIKFYGWTGSSFIYTARISAIATQAFTTTTGGTQLSFYTTAPGNTSPVRRAYISDVGALIVESSIHADIVFEVGGESHFWKPCTFTSTTGYGGIKFSSGLSSHPSTRALSLWYYGRHFHFGKADAPLKALGVFVTKTNNTSTTTSTSYFVDTSIPAYALEYPGAVVVKARGRITASASVAPTITFEMVLGSTTVSFAGATASLAANQWVWWELTWYLLKDDGSNTWKAHALWVVSGIIGNTTGYAQIDATNSRVAYHVFTGISPTSSQTFRVGMRTSSSSATIHNDYATVTMI